MAPYLGDIVEDATIRFIWSTNDSDGASITRATDGTVSVYKDLGTTQTVAGVYDTYEDFDGLTGVHGCRIDTSADAFYATGSDYTVVLSAATIDSQTVNAVLAHFSIENRSGLRPTTAGRTLSVSASGEAATFDVLVDTTISSLTDQTLFVIAAGSTDDDAYNGCVIVIEDASTAAQKAVGVISDYGGSARSVALIADPGIFDMAATDKVRILADRSLKPTTADGRTLDVTANGEAGLDLDNTSGTIAAAQIASNAITAAKIADNAIAAAKIATDAITAAKIAADAIGSSELASTAVNEIVDQVWDEAQSGHTTGGSFGEVATEVAAVLVDTAEIGAAGAGLTAVARAILPQINTAFNNIEFLMVDDDDHVTPKTGLTVSGHKSLNGGAFAVVAGTIAEVANGIYQFDALDADMNGAIVTFRFSATDADDTFITFKTTT